MSTPVTPVTPPNAPTKSTVGAKKFIERIQQQVRSRKVFPAGHTIAVAYAQLFGPKNAATPAGHPITISTGPFDNSVQTAVEAIAQRARKRFGYEVYLPDWELEMAEDVSISAGNPYAGKVPYSKFYHFAYLPERKTKWKDRKLTTASVTNHFLTSWYLTKNHAKSGYVIEQSLATTLIPTMST